MLASNRARFSASFRSNDRFSAQCPFRSRAWSSLQVIQHPVPPVFNPPMLPHNMVEPFRRAGCAQQVVVALFAFCPVLPPDGGHFAHSAIFDQSQARPVVRFL